MYSHSSWNYLCNNIQHLYVLYLLDQQYPSENDYCNVNRTPPPNRCVTCSTRIVLIDIFGMHIYQNDKYAIIQSFLCTNIFYSSFGQNKGKACRSKSGSNPVICEFVVRTRVKSHLSSPLSIRGNIIYSQLHLFQSLFCILAIVL